MKENRKLERYNLILTGEIIFFGETFSMETVNISDGGLCVTTDTPLMEGEATEVLLRLNNQDDFHLKISAKVIWCYEHIEVGFQSGISFSGCETERKRLKSYLKSCR